MKSPQKTREIRFQQTFANRLKFPGHKTTKTPLSYSFSIGAILKLKYSVFSIQFVREFRIVVYLCLYVLKKYREPLLSPKSRKSRKRQTHPTQSFFHPSNRWKIIFHQLNHRIQMELQTVSEKERVRRKFTDIEHPTSWTSWS